MKKFYIVTMLFSATLLAACNTTEQSTEKHVSSAPTEQPVEQKTEQSNVTEPLQSTETNETNETPTQATTQNDTNTITYTFNNTSITEDLTLTKSDNQNFSIELAGSFSLTAEEPGRDMVLFSNNNTFSMRIETFDTNITSFDKIVTDSESLLSLSAPNNTFVSYDVSAYAQKAEQVAAYSVTYPDDQIHAITVIVKQNGVLARFTIFDHVNESLADAFLQMAFTIQQ